MLWVLNLEQTNQIHAKKHWTKYLLWIDKVYNWDQCVNYWLEILKFPKWILREILWFWLIWKREWLTYKYQPNDREWQLKRREMRSEDGKFKGKKHRRQSLELVMSVCIELAVLDTWQLVIEFQSAFDHHIKHRKFDWLDFDFE